MCPRKPCLKPSTYSTLGTTSSLLPAGDHPPVRVADKPKRCQRLNNVFVDDRRCPDKPKYYKNLLHNIDGGLILRKLKHPLPSLDEVDPKFFSTYDESKLGVQLKKDLNLSHLEPAICNQIYALVKKYWSVFDDKGVFVPVKNYECAIDTGDAKPIAVKKDTLWAQGDPYHVDRHCCPQESRSYTKDNRPTLVIQSVVGSQTTSGAHV
jgi:hypothetical protein